ncbi:hypothetical protein BLA29_012807, partial [Euroglyphus maynei]
MRALNFVLSILTIKLCSIQAIVTEDTGPVCYGEYGCFNKSEIHKDWPSKNQIGHYPESPEKQNITFNLFSCQDRYNPTVLRYNVTENEMINMNYNPRHRTLVMIH